MKQKNIVKQAVVLLLILLMLVSSGAMGINTSSLTTNNTKKEASVEGRGLVWDNVMGVVGSRGGIIVATVRTEGIAFPADDFQFDIQQTVTSVAWQGGYFICQSAQGQKDYHWDWRILFWDDIGNGSWPGTEIYNQTIPDASITRSFWYNYTRPSDGYTYWIANYSCSLPEQITFNAGTKYWITFQAIQIPNAYPQGCWCRHNETVGGIKLHEAMFKAPNYWGYPNWVTIYAVLVASSDPDPHPHDLNFQLFSGTVPDTTPPETHCSFNGTNPVTVTITATDSESGVNHTYYKLDAAGYVEYSTPFMVSVPGSHTMLCYSVDKAGNQEVPHYCNFTVAQPPITITIKKGLGVTAVIKNTGATTLTNISWTITLDGKMIFVGKTKTNLIPSLAAGAEYKAKDFVLGFGKTNIVATAGGASANASGFVILIIVI
jgi:hypothetical protein